MVEDRRELRNAFGCFATGITVVTTRNADGAPVGITANSYSSLSLDPPLVLFCVDSSINSFEAFRTCEAFSINILRDDQRALSENFARSGDDKWKSLEELSGDNGCPVFDGSLAVLECDKHAMHEGGDHLIVIGRVTRMEYDEGKPLVYYRGTYVSLA